MKLVIGGAGQGKLAWVLQTTGLSEGAVTRTLEAKPIVDELQDVVRELLDRGGDPAEILAFAEAHPDTIFICDEVGSGVVPVQPEEREWREAVGRVCCTLARRADTVVRVLCGLPMTLKGETTWN